MNSFEKKYNITGWKGKKYSLTAKQLYERVLEDSKSDYNWIASATELVRVCNDPWFSERYVVPIKIIILNSFANLELQKEYYSNEESTDAEAVYSCYNSLPNTNKTAKKVKDKYLNAVITSVTKYNYGSGEVRFPLHIGPTYSKKVEEWKKKKFDEYVSAIMLLNFDQLKENLSADFNNMIKTAEQEGAFEKADNEYYEALERFYSINLKDL